MVANPSANLAIASVTSVRNLWSGLQIPLFHLMVTTTQVRFLPDLRKGKKDHKKYLFQVRFDAPNLSPFECELHQESNKSDHKFCSDADNNGLAPNPATQSALSQAWEAPAQPPHGSLPDLAPQPPTNFLPIKLPITTQHT